jgi:CIC family chloride channel protein
MTTGIAGIGPGLTIDQLSDLFVDSHTHGLPILDEEGELLGIVTLTDLDRALINQLPGDTPVIEVGTLYDQLLVARPTETMWEALTRMGTRGLGRLPVVDEANPRRMVGLVKRSDIIQAYNLALTRRAERQQQHERARLRNIDGTEFLEIDLKAGDAAIGKSLQEMACIMPRQCILVSIRRHGRVLIPHGDTVFDVGDHVTAFVNSSDVDAVMERMLGQRWQRA